MADETPINPASDATADDAPQAAAIAQYIKDLSVESPNSPQVFQWQGQPQVDVQFNINVDRIADEVHEVVLRINVSAKSDQGTHFLVDLSYAGLFGLRNFPDEALAPFMLVEAPQLIFPFARQVVAEAVQNTGFPPLLLEPIDFGRAFMATMETAQAQADQVPLANGAGDALPEGFDPALTDGDPVDPAPSKE
ncbi:MAG: protein-export chaperone SecB [Sphingomonas bacterium]|nr:protein-export chaperone SecB [Sphingomonas bacterium]